MWTPWRAVSNLARVGNRTAVENARVAAIACGAARLERIETELYVAKLAALRECPAITA